MKKVLKILAVLAVFLFVIVPAAWTFYQKYAVHKKLSFLKNELGSGKPITQVLDTNFGFFSVTGRSDKVCFVFHEDGYRSITQGDLSKSRISFPEYITSLGAQIKDGCRNISILFFAGHGVSSFYRCSLDFNVDADGRLTGDTGESCYD